jgi:hypothetical protein
MPPADGPSAPGDRPPPTAYDEPEVAYDEPIRTYKEPVREYEDPTGRYDDRDLRPSFADDPPPPTPSRPPSSRRELAVHETGEWTRSGWVPTPKRGDRPDFSIRRFEDTDERLRLTGQRSPNVSGQVVEDVDWYEQSDPTTQRVTMHTTAAEPMDPVTTRERPSRSRPASATRPASTRPASTTRDAGATRDAAESAPVKPSVVAIPPDDLDEDSIEDDYDDYDDMPPIVPVVAVTVSWYALPVTLYLLWLVVIPNNTSLVTGLVWVLPWLVGALIGGLVLAQILRIASGWKVGGIGFAAAIVSSGATTLIFSIVNPLPT